MKNFYSTLIIALSTFILVAVVEQKTEMLFKNAIFKSIPVCFGYFRKLKLFSVHRR